MNWFALVLPLVAADDPVTLGDARLSPGTNVRIESKLTFEQSIRPDPDGDFVLLKLEAGIDFEATMQPEKRNRSRALVRFGRAAWTAAGGVLGFDEQLPMHGRSYVLIGSGDEIDVARAEGMDDTSLPELDDEEISELRVYADLIVLGSPMKRALGGAAVERGKAVTIDPEAAGPLFEPCNQGSKLERCTLEFVEKRRVGAHDCAVFKVSLRAIDATDPEMTFEVLEELQGELVVTLEHGFPLSCRLRGTATARPRSPNIEMTEAPEGPGSREWTWTAKIE